MNDYDVIIIDRARWPHSGANTGIDLP